MPATAGGRELDRSSRQAGSRFSTKSLDRRGFWRGGDFSKWWPESFVAEVSRQQNSFSPVMKPRIRLVRARPPMPSAFAPCQHFAACHCWWKSSAGWDGEGRVFCRERQPSSPWNAQVQTTLVTYGSRLVGEARAGWKTKSGNGSPKGWNEKSRLSWSIDGEARKASAGLHQSFPVSFHKKASSSAISLMSCVTDTPAL